MARKSKETTPPETGAEPKKPATKREAAAKTRARRARLGRNPKAIPRIPLNGDRAPW